MYENPEIMRQLVNDRIDETRGLAAERRRAGSTRRDRRRNRGTSRFSAIAIPGRAPAPKPATA